MELVNDNPMAFFKRGEAKQTVGDLLGAVVDAEIAGALGHKGSEKLITEIKNKPLYKVQLVKSIFYGLLEKGAENKN